ncbi:SDR family NAD(P)-dependent oxidoreductase [Fibrella aquatilis]|uniref:SDR family oxidoreductase n=1 Tax=Fibrella aquatilis TaxID=2817059 RepID=A0A939JWJ2_9BACT|nr:SDR family NAD(P)-dependent oxidoreductase [Fibrella aquatilis]MBO0931972.1 SDR family oxidoreductase [Fibrella aquatilis]
MLISGTAGGQGRAAAKLFAQEGATVVGCDIKAAENDETARMIAEAGGTMNALTLDVTDLVQARQWIDYAVSRYGGIDVLYNNAALERFAPFAEMSADDWHYAQRHEQDVVFFPTQAAWSHLIARGGGSVINTGSVSGMRGSERIGSIGHAAGKGAVIAMTKQLALEGAPHNIRVNAISPGPIDTPVTAAGLAADPNFRLTYEGWPLLHRTGKPDDVAYCALWLASDESGFITGINVPVDGGWSAKGGLTAKSGDLVGLQATTAS